MKKIIIISKSDPTRAYSGLRYMAEALRDKGLSVQLIAWIPKNRICETNSWGIDVKSFDDFWYARIPVLRSYLVQLHILSILLFEDASVIFHELTFFRVLVFLKKIFPRRKYVHYATELYTAQDVPSHRKLLEFYKNNASTPDVVIECDFLRATYRTRLYNIKSPVLVIPNTIPKNEIGNSCVEKAPIDLYVMAGLTSRPLGKILVYTGAGYLHREIDRIIDGIALCKTDVFFLAFCYGPEKEIDIIREYANLKLGHDRVRICSSIERNVLLSCIEQADIGIVYYRPSLSVGNKYASPTKLYEYLSRGLPVLCSNNESLTELISDNNFGVCVADESIAAIGSAIDLLVLKLILEEDWPREIVSKFNESFEYAVSTEHAFSELLRII